MLPEGPESPDTAACKAAVTTGGTQPLYDWNDQHRRRRPHRTIIPDGTLCSAGRAKYRGFDAARTDWPSTALPAGGAYTFRYKATAPHPGTFEVYVTKNGYNPAQPLKWSDPGEHAVPFKVTNPSLVNGAYVMQGQLPSGRVAALPLLLDLAALRQPGGLLQLLRRDLRRHRLPQPDPDGHPHSEADPDPHPDSPCHPEAHPDPHAHPDSPGFGAGLARGGLLTPPERW